MILMKTQMFRQSSVRCSPKSKGASERFTEEMIHNKTAIKAAQVHMTEPRESKKRLHCVPPTQDAQDDLP